jgi:hypothetical protein
MPGVYFCVQIFNTFQRVFVGILCCALFVIPVIAHADMSDSVWLNASTPVVQVVGASLPDDQKPSQDNNQNCEQHTYTIGSLGATKTGCMRQTSFGMADGATGNVVPMNGTQAYKVQFANSFVLGPTPIPHQQLTLAGTNNANAGGENILYYRNILGGAQVSTDPLTHQQIYTTSKAADGMIRDKAGNVLVADSGITFSSNGAWMVYDVPHTAMVRVNLATFDVVPFDWSSASSNGTAAPTLSTAITDDGRYVAVASDTGSLEIYDLSTCTAVPDTIVGPVGCRWKTLTTNLSAAIAGYGFITNVHFVNDETLAFTTEYNLSKGHFQAAPYTISAHDMSQSSLDYLGLGDSYASGEGAFDYELGTDMDGNKCHTSLDSYPFLLGQQLFGSYKSIACSGAVTNDITDVTNAYKGQADPKIEKGNRQNIDQILANFYPGYISQLDFVQKYHPKNVTVSIGGNDIGFADMVKTCLGFGTCMPTAEDRKEKATEITSVFPQLVDTYTKLKENSAFGGKVYVVGYPYIASPGGDCGDNVRLDAEEVQMSVDLVDFLDADIQRAAAKAGVAYVDVRHALDGHRLCDAGTPAMNGLTLGNDQTIIGNESYHPNAYGHLLLDQTIRTQTNNFTEAMPMPQPTTTPLPLDTSIPFLHQPASGRAVNILENVATMMSDTVVLGGTASLRIDGLDKGLQAGSTYTVELHSDPILLDTVQADADGNINDAIQLPKTIPAGLHTLHVIGQSIAGQSVDMYKSVYVPTASTNNSASQATATPKQEGAMLAAFYGANDSSPPKFQTTSMPLSTEGYGSGHTTLVARLPEPHPIKSLPGPYYILTALSIMTLAGIVLRYVALLL